MKKILIMEDDQPIATALAIRLKNVGYEVLTVPDGLEGLKLAITSKPDLILMDVWMPGGIGCLIAERLKNVGLAHVPVIFLTASKQKEVRAMIQEVEPAGFFEKPYDPQQLLTAIHDAMAQT